MSLDVPPAYAVWADTRAGDPLSGKQNLARELVAFSGASPWRGPLRVAGVVLLVAGLVCGLVALSGRYRRRSS